MKIVCWHCDGAGQTIVQVGEDNNGDPVTDTIVCDACGGSGVLEE